jgi:hypothetical protein
MYYRDPAAEDKGILDGVIDLNGVNSVSEVQVARNYGFQTLVSVLSYNYYYIYLNTAHAFCITVGRTSYSVQVAQNATHGKIQRVH